MQMQFLPALIGEGDARPLSADHLDAVAVKADTEVVIWAKQINQDESVFHGHGGKDRRSADTKFMFADLVASGNGSGTAGEAITGELIARITDSDQRRVKADYTIGDLGELADARGDDRTERPVNFALAPYAKPGRHVELAVRANSSSDGYEVDNTEDPGTASSMRYWYTVVDN